MIFLINEEIYDYENFLFVKNIFTLIENKREYEIDDMSVGLAN